MMIKKNLIVFFLIASVFTAVAQETSKCEENFAAFKINVKAAKYNDALPQLDNLLKKCPKVNEAIYSLGEEVLRYKVEASQTKEDRQLYIDKILEMYSQHDKSFPTAKNSNDIKRALLKADYKLAPEEEVFGLLDTAFKTKRQDFTNYRALETYYNLYLKRFEAGEKGFTEQEFIKKYGELTTQVIFAKSKVAQKRGGLLTKQQTEILTQEEQEYLTGSQNTEDILTAVGENMDILSAKHFTCEKLEAFYSADYEEQNKNAEWLEAMAGVMFANKCYDSETLENGALALFETKPSSGLAFQLGTLYLRKNERKQAILYFDKAAQLEKDPFSKSDIYYKMAGIYRNLDKAEAKRYLLQSARFDEKSGRPYIMLAEMYSSVTNECDVTPFERKAILWLAIETVKKAGEVQPKYKGTANSMIEGYEKRLPTKEEVKEAGKRKGDEIKYGCWVNETVTIPNIK